MGRLSTLGLSRAGAGAALIAAAALVLVSQPIVVTRDARDPAPQATGTIRGVVTAVNPPATLPVNVTQDDAVCGKTQPDPTITIGAGGVVANAVVLLTGTKGGAADGPSVVNKQCRFVPHVQVAAPGRPLKIGSDDPVLHTTHAYAEDERTLFNVAMPIAGITVTRPLEKAKIVRLQCDTHLWMRGYIVITDERGAVTGADGRFQIEQVPAGTYDVRVWHERLKGAPQKVTVTGGATADATFTIGPA